MQGWNNHMAGLLLYVPVRITFCSTAAVNQRGVFLNLTTPVLVFLFDWFSALSRCRHRGGEAGEL